ncbi:MAG: patatin [Alphaproteobacteria bacterium]|nr:MAG: patatin [Alphaproteobacteria bacterium]
MEVLGVVPDLVAGASMGALVGAAWAAGRLDALEDWARAMTAGRYVKLIDVRPANGGLVQARKIAHVLHELGLPERIEDLPRSFAAVATDMESGREVWLREGSLTDAVRASVAIPGVISPHYFQDRWLLDGGLTNPVPVSLVRAMGASTVIAVNPCAKRGGRIWRAPEPKVPAWHELLARLPGARRGSVIQYLKPPDPSRHPPHYLDVIATAIDIMTEGIRRARLAGDPPDVMLPVLLEEMAVLDLHRAEPAIEAGRRAVLTQAEWIADLCGA